MSNHLIGVDVTQIDSDAGFNLGEVYETNNGDKYMYVEVASTVTAIAQYDTALIDRSDFSAIACVGGGASNANSKIPGFWHQSTSLSAGDFAWLLVDGSPRFKVAKACAEDAQLFTTDTSGVLDDAISTGSQYPVRGVVGVSISAGIASNTSGGNVDGRAVNAHIGPMSALD